MPRKNLGRGFMALNRRRCALIEKDIYGGGLTAEEQAEHDRLTAETDRRLDAAFAEERAGQEAMLRELEEAARRLGYTG